jgi:rare lipoprotein A (peptidoglycan hydrolase)
VPGFKAAPIANRRAGILRSPSARPTLSVLSIAFVLLAVPATPTFAKEPGKTYCFFGVCHRVLTLEETQRAVGRTETVIASFYDHPNRDSGNPSLSTSSGERFDPSNDRTAASPIYPNGTRLLVWNAKTMAAAEIRVTNSGPYHGARRLDVSRGAAERLGFRPLGVSRLSVTVLSAPTPQEAKYQKGRSYTPTAGYLGVFENAALAHASVGSGGQAARPAVAAGRAPKLIHTGSVGWDKSVKPVRPPLQRPTSATAQRPEPVTGSPGGRSATAVSTGWAATLVETPEIAPSRPAWPTASRPRNVLTLRPNGTP